MSEKRKSLYVTELEQIIDGMVSNSTQSLICALSYDEKPSGDHVTNDDKYLIERTAHKISAYREVKSVLLGKLEKQED